MLFNIAIAAFMFVVTTVIHGCGMMLALHELKSKKDSSSERLTRLFRVSQIIILMFLVSLLEVLAWAIIYLFLNAIEGIEKALYFSTVTFTTLGYGEIVLDERWRLLASFEAANGIIMFGWSTAIILAVIRDIYLGGITVK